MDILGHEASRILIAAAFILGMGGASLVLPLGELTGMATNNPCSPDAGSSTDNQEFIGTGSPDIKQSEDEILSRTYNPLTPAESYEKNLNIPDYNPQNSAHMLLEPGDNLESALNRDDKRVFFIKPGDYRGGRISISKSGSQNAPRWLIYYNPDMPEDRHPWHMANPESLPSSKRAVLPGLTLNSASRWRFDRIRFDDRIWLRSGSDNNVFNRLMFYKMPHRNTYGNINIDIEESDYNTVQNSVIGRTEGDFASGSSPDTVGVMLKDAGFTRIVGNEMFDFYSGDAIQSGQSQNHARGTIIQDNDIYRTSGFNKPVENGIDLKAGAADTKTGSVDDLSPKEWILVEHNRIWGDGKDMIYHYPSVSGVVIRGNIMWNNGKHAYTVHKKDEINNDHQVYDNIVYDSGGFKPRHIDDSLYVRNVFINADSEKNAWAWFANPERNTVKRNVFINTDVSTPQQGNEVAENAYYSSEPFRGEEPGRLTWASASDAQHDDLTFEIKQITGPETMTIPDGQVTLQSPHAGRFNLN